MIDCLFCDPALSRILARSGGWYVRFDNYPATKGHVEVVPFKHVGSWFSLSPVEQLEAFSLLAEAADVIASRRQVDGWNIFINDGPAAGRTIGHLHVHLVPRQFGDQKDPRGGCRRGLPNGDPTKWVTPQVQATAVARDGSTGSGT
ncbi:HIT domain-containing protein [Actinomadura sp. NPDC048394]|uniref:HIT family protein n=1 Tax=Actinomadura sp. NPDC048394 TaxID=3158223 RepID=UPI0033E22074